MLQAAQRLKFLIFLLLSVPLSAGMVFQTGVPPVAFQMMFNEGTGTTLNYTGSGGSGTCESPTISWNSGPPISGVGNGTSTIVTCNGMTLDLSSVTLSACINPTSFGEGNSGYIFATQPNPATYGLAFYLQDNTDQDGFGACISDTTGDDRGWDANETLVIDAQWKHLIAVFSGCGTLGVNCTGRLFLDGVEKTVVQTGTGTGTKRADSIFYLMGWGFNTGHNYAGLLHTVRVYTSAFNKYQAEYVETSANCGFVPPPPTPAITTTDCDLLMQVINASILPGPNDAGGQADPFEMTGLEHQSGDACRMLPGVRGR